MSYFVVISGQMSALVDVPDGRLVPITHAQPYVARLAAEIAAADGSPSLFWDDGTTGTSDDLVCAAQEEACEGRSIEASALGRLIESCEQHRVSARVWRANNAPDAFMGVPVVDSSTEAFAILQRQSGKGSGIGFVLQPNRAAP